MSSEKLSDAAAAALIDLLNSPERTNLELALEIWRAQPPHERVEERMRQFLQVLMMPNERLDELRTGDEDVCERWLNWRERLGDMGRVREATHIFTQTYYAWGGQSFGFSESEADVHSLLYESFMREGLEDWLAAQADDEQRQRHLHCFLQWWITFRLTAIRPMMELVAQHWGREDYYLWYYLGEVDIELGDDKRAEEHLRRYLQQAQERGEWVSRRSNLRKRTTYKGHYYDEEEAERTELLPNGAWYWLEFAAINDLGSHPRYHALPPNAMEAYEMLADIAQRRGDGQQAQALLQQAIDLCPDIWLAPRLKLAQAQIQAGKYTEVAPLLQRYWELLKAETRSRTHIHFLGWWGWQEEYPRLIEYLSRRYPLLHAGGDWWWLAERYYEVAAQMHAAKTHRQGIMRVLCCACEQWTALMSIANVHRLNDKNPYRLIKQWQQTADLPLRLLRALQRWGGTRRRKAVATQLQAVSYMVDSLHDLLHRYETQLSARDKQEHAPSAQFIFALLPKLGEAAMRYKMQLLQLYYRDWWQIRTQLRKYPLLMRYASDKKIVPPHSDAERFWAYLSKKISPHAPTRNS